MKGGSVEEIATGLREFGSKQEAKKKSQEERSGEGF